MIEVPSLPGALARHRVAYRFTSSKPRCACGEHDELAQTYREHLDDVMRAAAAAEVRDDAPAGVWVAVTESGTRYLLDLDAETVQRVPPPGGHLRGDGEPLRLVEWDEITVGLPMRVTVQHGRDEETTLRETTPVVSLARAPQPDPVRAA